MNVYGASLVAQLVNDLPAMQETSVQFLGGEDPLEEGMATYSNILAWRIPMNRDAWWGTIFEGAKSQTEWLIRAQKIASKEHGEWNKASVLAGVSRPSRKSKARCD